MEGMSQKTVHLIRTRFTTCRIKTNTGIQHYGCPDRTIFLSHYKFFLVQKLIHPGFFLTPKKTTRFVFFFETKKKRRLNIVFRRLTPPGWGRQPTLPTLRANVFLTTQFSVFFEPSNETKKTFDLVNFFWIHYHRIFSLLVTNDKCHYTILTLCRFFVENHSIRC